MIEFDGYISGEAKERLLEKARTFEQNIGIVATTLSLPIIILFGLKTQFWEMLWLYPIVIVLIVIFVRIPRGDREERNIIPKKVYIEKERVVCITNRCKESRLICDVKEVLDCKTYYELNFSFGKLTPRFICQKDLLTRGTLEEFEALFEGKITDCTGYFE